MIKFKKGFSLVEILIVIAVFSFISVIALDLFNSSMKASNKTKVMEKVRQDGQSIVDFLLAVASDSKKAEFLEPDPSHPGDFIACSSNCPIVEFTDLDGQTWRFVYTPTPPAVTSNGKIEVFFSDIGISVPLALSDTDPFSGVDITTPCCFSSIAKFNTSSPDMLKVSFTLRQGISAAARQDFQAEVQMEKSISLRNTF